MKNLKRIFSILLALSMVLGMGSFALADDGMGGVETEYLKEAFESPEITETTLIAPGDTFNGWVRQNSTTGTGFKYEIAAEGTNQFLQYYHTGSDIAAYRTFSKTFENPIKVGDTIRISFKLKKDSTYNGLFGIFLGNAEFLFRMSNNYMYPGKYGNNVNTAVAAIPSEKWNDIEFLIVNGETSGTYKYYLNGNKITAGITDQGGVNSGITDVALGEVKSFSLRSWANNDAGTANAKLYFDDISVTTVDEKRICEIAAERISIPSSATGNIALPSTGYGDTTIMWSSNNTAVIANDGTVTRPENGDIVPVTLTATITYGGVSQSFPYTVNVLPHTIFFYEDFEGADAGGDVAGYNSWNEARRRGSDDGTSCWDWSIKQETATNKTATVTKTSDTTGLDSGKINVMYEKREFDEISGKNATVTFRFKSDDYANHFEFMLLGNVTKYFVFRTGEGTITDGGSHLNGGSAAVKFNDRALNKWHTARFDLDLVNGLYDLYVDGTQLANDFEYNGTDKLTSLKGVGLSLIYSNWGSVGTSVEVDDVVVTTGESEYAYSVEDFGFKNANANACIYPEADGSVSSVTIRKYNSVEGASLIAAVYEGGKITAVSGPIDVTAALIGEDNTYTVNLPIASADAEIKAFVLDLSTVVPMALSKEYTKRSPLTVFIAGDSMAENVSGSTSSKEVDGETITYNREGWGMRIGEQFADGTVTVQNKAVGGRDTAEFISEGRLATILAGGHRGDFVFVSFGHNDDGSNITIDDYRANLAAYSEAIKAKGMTPIFVTPIARIATGAEDSATWTAGGSADDNLYEYAAAMVAEAAENGDVCLDLYTAFNTELTGKTYAEARAYYVPKNIDGTHLSTEGATLAAELIAELLSASDCVLKDLLK